MPISALRSAPFNLDWGDSIFAKVKATNVVGSSNDSTEGNGAVILTNPDAAHTLANDATVTSATKIKITWLEGAADGGTPVIDYRITYKEVGAGSFQTLIDGVQTTSYTTIALTSGSSYVFRVEARNSFGYSTTFSNELTVLQAQVPEAPINLANAPSITSSTSIGITWSPGVYDGASPVIDYRISFDLGTGSWVTFASGVTSRTYTATGLTADTVYKFKIEARNLKGYSAYSNTLSIRAASIPDKPSAPTTTVNAANVGISWNAPFNGGSPITAYTIWIR